MIELTFSSDACLGNDVNRSSSDSRFCSAEDSFSEENRILPRNVECSVFFTYVDGLLRTGEVKAFNDMLDSNRKIGWRYLE
jgi:hypothetical protein